MPAEVGGMTAYDPLAATYGDPYYLCLTIGGNLLHAPTADAFWMSIRTDPSQSDAPGRPSIAVVDRATMTLLDVLYGPVGKPACVYNALAYCHATNTVWAYDRTQALYGSSATTMDVYDATTRQHLFRASYPFTTLLEVDTFQVSAKDNTVWMTRASTGSAIQFSPTNGAVSAIYALNHGPAGGLTMTAFPYAINADGNIVFRMRYTGHLAKKNVATGVQSVIWSIGAYEEISHIALDSLLNVAYMTYSERHEPYEAHIVAISLADNSVIARAVIGVYPFSSMYGLQFDALRGMVWVNDGQKLIAFDPSTLEALSASPSVGQIMRFSAGMPAPFAYAIGSDATLAETAGITAENFIIHYAPSTVVLPPQCDCVITPQLAPRMYTLRRPGRYK